MTQCHRRKIGLRKTWSDNLTQRHRRKTGLGKTWSDNLTQRHRRKIGPGTTWSDNLTQRFSLHQRGSVTKFMRKRLIPRRRGCLGRWMVCSRMLAGGCRVRFWMRRPYCTLDRRRYGLRMVEMLLVLSASCVFPLRLHASLPRTYDWIFSLMSVSCLGLRPSAAMADGLFPPVHAVSSAGLCNAFLKLTFLLGAR